MIFSRASVHVTQYWQPLKRTFLSNRQLTADHSIYVSNSTNPYFNLSLEDWLFRTKCESKPLLLLYRDDPCVVIGRNQNPWKEVNFSLLAKKRVLFIRRRSGGGTVYHDIGNTNYSIHIPRSSFNRTGTAQIIIRALQSVKIDAYLNDRNDISVSGYKMRSAYKIVKGRAYHHGTMLISTDLASLSGMLHVEKDSMITRGVASVRSSVQNLQHFCREMNHERFVAAAAESFQKEYNLSEEIHYVNEDEAASDVQAIQDGMNELKSWDWKFGQTPEFTYTLSRSFDWGFVEVIIRSKYGKILTCTISSDAQNVEWGHLSSKLEDTRYGFIESLDQSHLCNIGKNDSRLKDVEHWIIEETCT